MLTDIITGLTVAIITGTWTWLYKRKFSLRFRYTIKHGTLSEFFAIIKKACPEIRTLKILANVTNVILPAFEDSKLNAIGVQVLLRKPNTSHPSTETKYNSYFEAIIEDWINLEKQGRIKKLEVKYFDFLTTDWQIIADDKFIILGLNVPQKNNWKSFEIMDAILIAGDSDSGKSLIEKYSNRFNRFFSEYAISTLN